MATTAAAPDGTTWRIGRRWLHHRPRWRGRGTGGRLDMLNAGDFLDVDAGGLIAGIVIGIVLAVVAVVAVVFVFPLVVLLVEILLALLLVVLAVVARVVLREPWTVEAVNAATSERLEWKVVGWRASGLVIARVANAIRRGDRPNSAVVQWLPG